MTRNSLESLDFSLILALYNEGQTLPQSLRRIFEVLDKSGLKYEIILINDKSRDQSAEWARQTIAGRDNCRLIQHQQNIGRGGTVQEGFKIAQGKVVGFIDVDLEVGPDYMPDFVKKILSGEADVITGLRHYKSDPLQFIRFLATHIYHYLVVLLIGLTLRDTETGYKFFLREKILPVLNQIKDTGWFWDTEIMAWSQAAKLSIKELPVIFRRRTDKKSTVRLFKDSMDYLVKLWYFRKRIKIIKK